MAGTRDRRRLSIALAAAAATVAIAAAASAPVQAGAVATGVTAKAVGGQFSAPVFVTRAPGYPKLLFVVEQRGTIQVLRNGKRLGHRFLDMRDGTHFSGEQGLLSLAFPPDYRKSGKFYVYFTSEHCNTSSGGCDNEVDQYRRRPGHPSRAIKGRHRKVIRIRHRGAGNHNGGTIMFGPDRKLWVATGDGGGGNDSFDNARRRTRLLGKLLRIDPRRSRNGKRGYRIPKSNPFVGKPGRDEVWSIGLRNPFRFSFDVKNKAIIIGDVGDNFDPPNPGPFEEVNYVRIAEAKGANFGWPFREGLLSNGDDRPQGLGPLIDPIHVYDHNGASAEHGCAITGGIFLRDPRLKGDLAPANHRYLYGDACESDLRSFKSSPGGPTNDFQKLSEPVSNPVDFAEDSKHRVYVVAYYDGHVFRLDPT